MLDAALVARDARLWRFAAYGYALVLALSLGYFIAGNPLQIGDMLGNLLQVQKASLWEMTIGNMRSHGFLRPMLWAPIDITFDLARGHYYEMYKGIHIAQVVLTAVLFVTLLRVRTMWSVFGAMLGVAMVFGSRTFAGTVYESHPINTFLTIVICALATAWLALGTHAWWRDAVAPLLFAFAALAVEHGLVLWVIVVAAWLMGARGVSTKGVLLTAVVLVAYFALRFGPLNVGAPGLEERSSGFGFRVLDGDELVARFGAWPYGFYAYNVASQILSVLFSEPTGGVWALTRNILAGGGEPYQYIAFVASAGATAVIAWYVVPLIRRWRASGWRGDVLTDGDRLVMLFLAVLGGNALISYPYTKPVIMSPAGVFHALAAAVAFSALLERLSLVSISRLTASVVTALSCVLCAAWAIRLVTIDYAIRDHAFTARNDWAEVFGARAPIDFSADPKGAELTRHLQRDAIVRRVPPSYFAQPRLYRYLELPF